MRSTQSLVKTVIPLWQMLGKLTIVFYVNHTHDAIHSILKGWSIVDRLDQIEVPTLVINGRGDIAQDFVVAPFFQKIKKVKWITFEKSTHTPMFEERELFMKRVKEFVEL